MQMEQSVQILPLREEHAPILAQLEKQCFSEPRSEAQLRAEVQNPLARFFVAEILQEDGCRQVAGYAGMQNIAGECYVENIAVFPELRGKGIGRKLVCALIAAAKAEQSTLLTLEVRPSNTVALQLYESLGFQCVGERKDFYTHPTENALLLTRYFDEETKAVDL